MLLLNKNSLKKMISRKLQSILDKVEKPSRYTGGEFNRPHLKDDGFSFCLCFPDVYEVGMSNLGIRIIEESINRLPFASCDSCFAPWRDFGLSLKQNNMPLYSLGLKKPLIEFDMLGFSLHYEMCYTNVLYMLDLAGIPFLRERRKGKDYPLVVFGGPCTFNPEPVADFADIIFIGDGEENLAKAAELFVKHKDRAGFLRESAKIDGVYVPEFLEVSYNSDGTIKAFTDGFTVKKAFVKDLDSAVFPKKAIVANCEAVHDRAVIEVMRGCSRGCRFCQAGYIYRPVRFRSVETLIEQSKNLTKSAGYEELSLNSLSTGDYPHLVGLIDGLEKELEDIKVALPSLRLDNFDSDFAKKARKSSLTFAPEAGSQRLRDVINKDITEDEIMRGVDAAFSSGYFSVKLYFMIGLPTEGQADLEAIRDIVEKISNRYRALERKDKPLRISVSAATFVPKPHTPFEWERFCSKDEVEKKQQFLRSALKMRGVKFSWGDYYLSALEAVFARGDRRLSSLIVSAYNNGCIFDAWDECFDKAAWGKAFIDSKVDMNFYLRERGEGEVLPWDFIDIFVDKDFLQDERSRAKNGEVSGSCMQNCLACGVQKQFDCNFKG